MTVINLADHRRSPVTDPTSKDLLERLLAENEVKEIIVVATMTDGSTFYATTFDTIAYANLALDWAKFCLLTGMPPERDTQ